MFGNIKDFDSQDALMYTGVIAGSAACMPFDEDFRDFMLNNRSSAADKYFDFHNELGSLQGMGIIVGSTYLTGLVFDSDKLRGTGRLMFEALLLSGTTPSLPDTVRAYFQWQLSLRFDTTNGGLMLSATLWLPALRLRDRIKISIGCRIFLRVHASEL
jgi:hypothetical protein